MKLQKGRKHGQAGVSRLGVLVFVLLIVSAIFVASQVFPFFYYYYEILGLMEAQAAKASVFTDQEIREVLWEKIKKSEIPIDDKDDLKINRVGRKIIIDLKYQEVLYIDLGGDRVYDLYVFDFNPHVEEEY